MTYDATDHGNQDEHGHVRQRRCATCRAEPGDLACEVSGFKTANSDSPDDRLRTSIFRSNAADHLAGVAPVSVAERTTDERRNDDAAIPFGRLADFAEAMIRMPVGRFEQLRVGCTAVCAAFLCSRLISRSVVLDLR